MESSNSYRTSAKGLLRGHGQDRISNLPEPMFQHILSCLTTREAVQTSVLAKRWRNLWASTRHLDFDEDEFSERGKKDDFEPFIDRVLLLREPSSLETFRLRCRDYFDEQHFNSWFAYAARHNVKVLHFETPDREGASLPPCIFTCERLQELVVKLKSTLFEIHAPKITANLKKVYLDFYTDTDGLIERLVSECPELESLELMSCSLKPLSICSSRLKDLRIVECYIESASSNRISAPGLISLVYVKNTDWAHLHDGNDRELLLENLHSLVTASVHPVRAGAINLIKGIANAKYIEFTADEECISTEEFSSFPIFHNLKKLSLSVTHRPGNSELVSSFLRCSPNLEQIAVVATQPL